MTASGRKKGWCKCLAVFNGGAARTGLGIKHSYIHSASEVEKNTLNNYYMMAIDLRIEKNISKSGINRLRITEAIGRIREAVIFMFCVHTRLREPSAPHQNGAVHHASTRKKK